MIEPIQQSHIVENLWKENLDLCYKTTLSMKVCTKWLIFLA